MLIDDDGKLKRKISNKKVNASQEGIEFELSFDDVINLMKQAKITSSQWSHKKFHLSRYNDSGPYKFDNCRFILAKENYREKKISSKSREASKRNLKALSQRDDLGYIIHIGLKNSPRYQEYLMERREKGQLLQQEKEAKYHLSYKGDRNSQFGTFWITNGIVNSKCVNGQIIPEGFYKGRIVNCRRVGKSGLLPVLGTGLT